VSPHSSESCSWLLVITVSIFSMDFRLLQSHFQHSLRWQRGEGSGQAEHAAVQDLPGLITRTELESGVPFLDGGCPFIPHSECSPWSLAESGHSSSSEI
jgi:hypothetical protein